MIKIRAPSNEEAKEAFCRMPLLCWIHYKFIFNIISKAKGK